MPESFEPKPRHIALLGIGEAAGAFLEGWDRQGCEPLSAFDVKSDQPATRGWVEERCRHLGVVSCPSAAEAVRGAQLILSLVTADQALNAATAAAPGLAPGALYVDGNSCSPQTKCEAAVRVEAAGGRYVDMAIMAPVHPRKHLTPVLLAGPHADAASGALASLGMRPGVAGDQVGQASTIKMVRSVMIKGIEALTAECMLAARRAGVADAVLASLQASDASTDWRARAGYNLERMMVHGGRRAAEMREVARTVAELGISDRMSRATAEWQQAIGDLGLEGGEDRVDDRADRILAALDPSHSRRNSPTE
jgi:3-hydroxyisobutyrate dehydrogenase-like beta-hydroxyacid dehydrogenase